MPTVNRMVPSSNLTDELGQALGPNLIKRLQVTSVPNKKTARLLTLGK